MDKQQVEQRTYELYQGGLICSEAVLTAVLESAGAEASGVTPRIATAFGGGVGRCREEMCGALAGGLIALGALKGRTKAGENWDGVAAMAAEYRERFKAVTGHTRCRDVLHALGAQENMEKCKRLTAGAAGLLAEMLEAPDAPAQPLTCGCCAGRN